MVYVQDIEKLGYLKNTDIYVEILKVLKQIEINTRK